MLKLTEEQKELVRELVANVKIVMIANEYPLSRETKITTVTKIEELEQKLGLNDE